MTVLNQDKEVYTAVSEKESLSIRNTRMSAKRQETLDLEHSGVKCRVVAGVGSRPAPQFHN